MANKESFVQIIVNKVITIWRRLIMLWFNSNKRIDKLEKQLIEINEALREERNNTKQLTKAVTQIYNLLAKVININSNM
jgi:hypothetical protein